MPRPARARLCRSLIGMAVAFVTLSGCVGSIDRDEFDAEIQARGGGLSGEQLVDAVQAVEQRVDSSELWFRSASVSPFTVYLEVSSPDIREEVDSWVWTRGKLTGPRPERNLEEDELTPHFTAGVLDAQSIERSIDAALAQSSLRGSYATSLNLEGSDDGSFRASVSITNQRDTEVWYFGPDGAVTRTAP